MSSETKNQGKDKDEDKSSKTHKRKSSSEPKIPSPFITRIVRRVKDAYDEYIERMEDMEHGRRDSMGRQTQKGIEHYYEIERRRRKREDRRRGKEKREQKKDAEGGGVGGGVVEALMTGGRGEPGHRGGGSPRGTNDEDPFIHPPAMEGPIHETQPDAEPEGALPPPAIGNFAQDILPTIMEHAGSQSSRASRRKVSPMPSDHSISSTRAQVGPRPIGERVRIKAPAGRGPPLDSEDEESPTSDEGSASEDEEDDQAAKAARDREAEAAAGEVPTGEAAAVPSPPPAGEEQPSGIRGGGDGGIVDLDDYDADGIDDDRQFEDAPVYNEREDFDDEYTTAAGYYEPFETVGDATKGKGDRNDEQPAKHIRKEFQAKDKQKDKLIHGQPQDHLRGVSQGMFQSRERRPYNVGAKEVFPEIFTVRTPRPYAHAKVGESSRARRTEAPVGPGASHQHHTKSSGEPKPNGKKAPALFRDSDSDGDFPTPNSQPRACAGAGRTRDARKNRSAKAGLDTEADLEYDRAYEPSQAKPNMKSNVHHNRRGDPFLNRESYHDDEYDDEDDSSAAQVSQDQKERDAKVFERHAAAFRERIERARAAPQKQFIRGAAAAFVNRPYAMPHAERVPQPRFPQQGGPYPRQRQSSFGNTFKGPPYGDSFGAGSSFSRKPRVVPEDQESPVQDDRYSHDGSQSSDAGVSKDTSSASEQSSDTEQIPTPYWKKAAQRSYDHGYSSSSAVPPPRKPAKAKAERSRAEAGSSPAKSWRTNESKRHATADSPPPPKYKDVVKDIPPNYYARLGLSEDATAEEIKKASKMMRVKTHPDQVKRGNPNMTEEDMAKVTATAANVGEAADVLEDPRKKMEYDERIRVWKRKHGGRLPEEEA
ncbi:MAG: hypothetical protein Q9171_007198 [Xanthocarpia ochracea]